MTISQTNWTKPGLFGKLVLWNSPLETWLSTAAWKFLVIPKTLITWQGKQPLDQQVAHELSSLQEAVFGCPRY